MSEALVQVEGFAKKFSRSLKHALWYEVQDLASEFFWGRNECRELRETEFWALRDISFELKRGDCIGLIGPNGSGKSTLLRLLNGLIKPDRGRARVRGRVGALIALGMGFNPVLTGRENVYANGAVLGFSRKEIDSKFDAIVKFSELEDSIDAPIHAYSSGMKVRLGFSIAVQIEQPDVLLIDEILAVGDKGFRTKCINAILGIMKNTAVVFVSHSMNHVSRLCSGVLVLDHGQILYGGHDVEGGIRIYESLFQGRETSIEGSGKATIHKIELESGGKRDVNVIDYLDDLSVHMDVSLDPSVHRFAVHLGIKDQDLGVVVSCRSNTRKIRLANTAEVLRVSAYFGSLALSPGVYRLNVSVCDEEGKETFAGRSGAASLTVRGAYNSSPIQIAGEWKVAGLVKEGSLR